MQDTNETPAETSKQEPTINAAAWVELGRKTAETVTVTLPSGAVVKTRKPAPLNQLLKGRLSTETMKAALESHTRLGKQNASAEGQAQEAEYEPGTAANMLLFMATLVCDHVIEPRIVVENPKAGEISAAQVPDQDFAFLFMHATGQNPSLGGLTGSVDLFRTLQSLSINSDNGKGIQSTPKQFGGSRQRRRGRRS